MNSCILMAQIVSQPELRSTQDQTSVSTMMVEFESTRDGDAPGKVQVEGWGNLAEEIKNTYSLGDQVIIEGRLSMNVFEMPEGYKEKRAKLVASRIYPMGTAGGASYQQDSNVAGNIVDFAPSPQSQPAYAQTSAPAAESTLTPAGSDNSNNEDWDEIPF